MYQVHTPEEKDVSIHTKIQKFSESLTRFDARLRGLEAQYKSQTSRPSFFQNNSVIRGSHMHSHQSFHQFLRTGESSSFCKGLSSSTASGVITLPQMHHEIVEKALPDYSPLRKLARTTQIASDSLELLVDHGNGDVGWVLEKDEREETTPPELAKIKIQTHEMYARPRASQKLLDDVGIDLESWITTKIAWQMGRIENQAFILGNGEGKPKGFLTYPLCNVGKGTFGTLESLPTKSDGALENSDVLIDLFHSMKPEYLEGSVWLMSRATLNMVRKLKDKQNNYLYHIPVISGEKGTLLGHEVIITDDMPAPEKDSMSIVFANFSHAYHIVERQDIQVLRDPYSAKPYIEFYATKRIGGDVINFDAIKVLRFSAA